ncbi:nocobactin polyketide synthase NbtC [Mycobacterium sp.]|uniref:nocobactin polyketide synthase NbtC n=1 Tax=Mycobacterium sp. TaxID=1785 RepID=UPI003BAA511A
MPNGTTPVLLSADTADLLRQEAAALLSYTVDYPETTPDTIADMLFRTRLARRHRALAMVSGRDELVNALRAVVDDHKHPALIQTNAPAAARRLAYVFPGQGQQHPGMGRLFYESIPTFRAEVDRCNAAFEDQLGESPMNYLLDEHFPAEERASTVQPALFTQMAGLAAMWRSFGIVPNNTIGHSQGEVAAAYVSGLVTLEDAARVIGLRAHAVDEFAASDYAMAIVAANRDVCEEVIARCSGWAEVSVVNSPSVTGISGDRDVIQNIVDTFTERGTFAKVIRVRYPAHTSMIHTLGDTLRAAMRRHLQHPSFLDTNVTCLGATLGSSISQDLPVEQYWFWNLRNTVRFDKAIAAAAELGIDTFVELAAHPTLTLAIHENLAARPEDEHETRVVATSARTATDLGDFAQNLALLAVHDLDYSWECLRTEPEAPIRLPLVDFPNTLMNETRLWLPYDEVLPRRARPKSGTTSVVAQPESTEEPTARTAAPRLLTEKWVGLSHRSLVPPRAIGIVDHAGGCSELANALCDAATNAGATAYVTGHQTGIELPIQNGTLGPDLDTYVILLPQSPKLDYADAATEVAAFFGNRTWWPGLGDTVAECWLVTVAAEVVAADDEPPDPVHAAASAGFRSIGAEHPGIRFRHLDLPADALASVSAATILSALHTAEEPELALRVNGIYAKRIVEDNTSPIDTAVLPEEPPRHVLIIGGTGNLGLEFCHHFAHRGAKRITLVSRSGETAAVANRLQQIRMATTTTIQVNQCDVGDPAAVAQLAEQQQNEPADLIIHAALTYSDIELDAITVEKTDQMMRAKVVGIWQVLQTFPRTDDCRVVLCSSAAATIGGRGQIIYAAANRMLDAMAHWLRAQDLDCVSVQWGQWTVHFDLDDSGWAKLAAVGLLPMSPTDALAVGMTGFRRNAVVAAFDLDRARPVLDAYGYGPLLSQLASPSIEADNIGSQVQPQVAIDNADLPQQLMTLLAEAIGLDGPAAIDTSVPMVAIGLDSLQALEFRRRVKMEFNHDIEVADLLSGASVADILAKLDALAPGPRQPATP